MEMKMHLLIATFEDKTQDEHFLTKTVECFESFVPFFSDVICCCIGTEPLKDSAKYPFQYYAFPGTVEKNIAVLNIASEHSTDMVYFPNPELKIESKYLVGYDALVILDYSQFRPSGDDDYQKLAKIFSNLPPNAHLIINKNDQHIIKFIPENLVPIIVDDFSAEDGKNIDWAKKTQALVGHFKNLAKISSKATEQAPYFSIIIPTYNHSSFIPKTIESLARQDLTDTEIIIVNDGSTDDTASVIKAFIAKLPDIDIKYVEQTNQGDGAARNTGFALAKGKWLLYIDSDDIMADGYLAAAKKDIAQHPYISALSGYIREFGDKTTPWRPLVYRPGHLKWANHIPGPCTMFRRYLWSVVAGFDVCNPWSASDWNFWLKCESYGWLLAALAAPMLHYRVRVNGSITGKKRAHLDEFDAFAKSVIADIYPVETVLTAHQRLLSLSAVSQERLQKKIRLFPKQPALWLWIGFSHERDGKIKEAVSSYKLAIKLGGSTIQWQAALRLYFLYISLGYNKDAEETRHICMEIKPELEALLSSLVNLSQEVNSLPYGKASILLVLQNFWPHLDEIAEKALWTSKALMELGYDIHVATRYLKQRKQRKYMGIHIHEFPFYGNLTNCLPGGLGSLHALLKKHTFSALFIFGSPSAWSTYICNLPKSTRPRIIFQPDFNKLHVERLANLGILPGTMASFKSADLIWNTSEKSWGAQLYSLSGCSTISLPPILKKTSVTEGSFREKYSIAKDTILFLTSGDITPINNQVGLIHELQKIGGNWQLAITGYPADPSYVKDIHQIAEKDHRILILKSPCEDEVGMAMQEANFVLEASHTAQCPMSLLRAMRYGTVWLATQGCESAQSLTGGIVAEEKEFPLIIEQILHTPEWKEQLQTIGQKHFEYAMVHNHVISALDKGIKGENMQYAPNLQKITELHQINRRIRAHMGKTILEKYGVELSPY